MNKRIVTSILIAFTIVTLFAFPAHTASKQVTLMAPSVWNADGSGTYSFKNTKISGAEVAKNGSVVSGDSSGTCEGTLPYKTGGVVNGITANWVFTGQVTMEVSATGDSKDYVPAVSGVPLGQDKIVPGSTIKWRATLGPKSVLNEVKIAYTDLSGVAGTFGNELLSGFSTRRLIYIKGSASGDLFNYQMRIRIGESAKAGDCDVCLNGPVKSNFADIRFTQADGETTLPFYRESITGTSPNRIASFWVNIPQIPKTGLPIYVYYGKEKADDLSGAEGVFDFFDDFDGDLTSEKKWKIVPDTEAGSANFSGSLLLLNSAKVITNDYKFGSGIIEHRSRLSGSGVIVAIAKRSSSGDSDLIAYSSTTPASAHCVATGSDIRSNDPKPIDLNTFYNYRVICDPKDGVIFQRYGDDWLTVQAEAKYASPDSGDLPIGLSPGKMGSGMACEWIRVRKYANPSPEIDRSATSSLAEEAAVLPEFYNTEISADGGIILADHKSGGYYIATPVKAGFNVRIITPAWDGVVTEKGSIAIGIATKDKDKFYTGWQNGVTRYVSKKEFLSSGSVKWKADLLRKDPDSASGDAQQPVLRKLSLNLQPGTIRVVMPSGGEIVKPESKFTIFWEAAGYEAKYPVDISYSVDGGDTFNAVASRVSNTGDYAWDVPSGECDKVMIKVADSFDKTVYGVSEACFTLSTSKTPTENVVPQTGLSEDTTTPASTQGTTQAAKESEKYKPGMYELLVKVYDKDTKGASAATEKGFYEQGDIVMIKPAGSIWGSEERSKFAIVQVQLSAQDLKDLLSAKDVPAKFDAKGKQIKRVVPKRKFKVDLVKQGLLDAKTGARVSSSSGPAPVLKRDAVEEKK